MKLRREKKVKADAMETHNKITLTRDRLHIEKPSLVLRSLCTSQLL
jgi:hypothetical protein